MICFDEYNDAADDAKKARIAALVDHMLSVGYTRDQSLEIAGLAESGYGSTGVIETRLKVFERFNAYKAMRRRLNERDSGQP
jgi:hypothetical protein